jgi:hypothetical protein
VPRGESWRASQEKQRRPAAISFHMRGMAFHPGARRKRKEGRGEASEEGPR